MLVQRDEWLEGQLECRIMELLAAGGTSEIYLARLKNTGNLLAAKVAEPDKRAGALLQNEYEMLKNLRFQGIPRVLELVRKEKYMYLLMPYYSGKNLEEYIKAYGPLSEGQVIAIAQGLCRILCYLHRKDKPVLHNDIKPSNILIQEDTEVLLLDFGLAQYEKEHRETILFQGTLGYAAPECWHQERERVSGATDIFALGATIYRLLEGQEPKEHFGNLELTDRDRRRNWQAFINKCCALDVAKRYQSAAQVYRDLNGIGNMIE